MVPNISKGGKYSFLLQSGKLVGKVVVFGLQERCIRTS